MKSFKNTIVSALVLVSLMGTAYAGGTKAFGLTLGETTVKQLKKAYPQVSNKGTNKWSQGAMYTIPASAIKFDGCSGALAIFSTEGKLVALNLEISKHRFKELHQMLSRKYHVLQSDIPFVGDAFARYANGDDIIEMAAPHLSFEMSLLYAEKSFMDAYNSQSTEETQKKSNNEFNQL